MQERTELELAFATQYCCTRLKDLNLGWNRLTGPIPPELAQCVSLMSLKLHKNQLSGSVPDLFDSLTELQDLFLQDNQLSGSLPLTLFKCTSQKRLCGTIISF